MVLATFMSILGFLGVLFLSGGHARDRQTNIPGAMRKQAS